MGHLFISNNYDVGYTYQKIFSFTHNDLHTNNIMFIEYR